MKQPDKIVSMPVDKLVPYARNARTHSEVQVAQIAASMREFGWTNPVLVDGKGGIIAGHGRVLAARQLGIESVPCIVLGHLTETQKRALVLADNKLALNAGWDDDLLRIELQELKVEAFDLSLAGFELDEVEALLSPTGNEGLTDPDDVPEPSTHVVSKLGDVWKLGRHRLMCGDSTKAADVERLLDGVKPHLMVTDPPYGVNYDPQWHVAAAAAGKIKGAGKRGEVGVVSNDDRADWREAYALFSGDVAYVWHAGLFGGIVAEGLLDCGLELRAQIIWTKSSFAIGRGHYHWQHEPCWYAVRKGGSGGWVGDRSQATVWKIDKQTSDTGHGTQKPVDCMRRPIENNSSSVQAVYEPFSGSGTTIIAAEQTGRCCYAMEISPAYVDLAVRRWEAFTGEGAVNAETGEQYPEAIALVA